MYISYHLISSLTVGIFDLVTAFKFIIATYMKILLFTYCYKTIY